MTDSVPNVARVLIVGAGPTGLTAALELTRRGHSVRIIEKNRQRDHFSKAFGITAGTMQLLEPSGATTKLLGEGRKVSAATFMRGEREIGRIDFSQLAAPWNFLLVLPQSETEEILESTLAELGVKVERGCELIDFSQSDSGVCATVDDTNGNKTQIEASLMLAADGARSRVRKSLGIGFPGETMKGEWSLADIRCEMPVGTELGPVIRAGSERLLFILRLHDDLFRVVSNLPGALGHLPAGSTIHEIVWQSNFAINHRQAETYRVGRVFLAGDAAHIHSPLGGRGMNLGIEDAAEFARMLDRNQLDDYHPLRHTKGAKIVRLVSTLTRVMASPRRGPKFFRMWLLPSLLRMPPFTRMIARRMIDP